MRRVKAFASYHKRERVKSRRWCTVMLIEDIYVQETNSQISCVQFLKTQWRKFLKVGPVLASSLA